MISNGLHSSTHLNLLNLDLLRDPCFIAALKPSISTSLGIRYCLKTLLVQTHTSEIVSPFICFISRSWLNCFWVSPSLIHNSLNPRKPNFLCKIQIFTYSKWNPPSMVIFWLYCPSISCTIIIILLQLHGEKCNYVRGHQSSPPFCQDTICIYYPREVKIEDSFLTVSCLAACFINVI